MVLEYKTYPEEAFSYRWKDLGLIGGIITDGLDVR